MTNPPFQTFLYRFYQTEKGRALFRQEKHLVDQALAQVFGLYLVQLGITSSQSMLENSRVGFKLVTDQDHLACDGMEFVQSDIDYLPFKADTIDVAVMPHTLETVPDPYHLLRQVDQMLIPEGHLLITGFNPLSCQTMRNRVGEYRRAFKQANLLRAHRVIDWLNVLGYDIEMVNYSSISCLSREEHDMGWQWVERIEGWLNRAGFDFGNVYCILAKKRIASPTPVGLNWRLSNWLPMKKRGAMVTNRVNRGARKAQRIQK